jgi:hypothetical protein
MSDPRSAFNWQTTYEPPFIAIPIKGGNQDMKSAWRMIENPMNLPKKKAGEKTRAQLRYARKKAAKLKGNK